MNRNHYWWIVSIALIIHLVSCGGTETDNQYHIEGVVTGIMEYGGNANFGGLTYSIATKGSKYWLRFPANYNGQTIKLGGLYKVSGDIAERSKEGSYWLEVNKIKLIKTYTDIDKRLLKVSGKRDLQAIKTLIDSGADVNVKSASHSSPLNEVLGRLRTPPSNNPIKIVELLLNKGADPSSANSWGWSALHEAVNANFSNIVKLLLENGADPNTSTKKGETPLHTAANQGENSRESIKLLISHGAKLAAQDSAGKTPYDLAPHGIKDLLIIKE